jgi:hypothetical protein
MIITLYKDEICSCKGSKKDYSDEPLPKIKASQIGVFSQNIGKTQ